MLGSKVWAQEGSEEIGTFGEITRGMISRDLMRVLKNRDKHVNNGGVNECDHFGCECYGGNAGACPLQGYRFCSKYIPSEKRVSSIS